jgi:class 3 adenylate cyclase
MIILVVDDEEGVRRSLKKALARDDVEVLLAENGDRALEMVTHADREFDVVISDFKMPGRDGLETLMEIGRQKPEITRIMLTGYATMERAIDSVNAGIDGFLTKPFDNAELRAKTREYVLKKRLKQFVSEQVYMEMQRHPHDLLSERRRVTVLFADIRDFSGMVQHLPPDVLSDTMNQCFYVPLDEVICTHNGMLDKHIGDSVMGVFGAPISYGNDAERAVVAAIRAREVMAEINHRFRDTGEISLGIGIATGEVQAGFFGSHRRKEYTVMGLPVVVAARLENLAGKMQILICEETYREVRNLVSAEKVPSSLLKGMNTPLEVYEILDIV